MIHPNETIVLRLRDPPKSFRTQYQIQNKTQFRNTQKVIKKGKKELEFERYPQKNKNQLLKNLSLI